MLYSPQELKYPFHRAETYCIRILGFLDQSWSERLAGMRITTESQGDQGAVTALIDSVPEQAALSGVLETLYDSHFTLISVEMLKD
jgi:hypothetical protein